MIPCGWCRKKLKIGELREHVTVCPKRPAVKEKTA
jgi:hypothetical protein